MRKIVQLFIITLLILTGRVGVAQTPGTDFTHTASGIHYMITSVSPRTVGVIRPWNNTLYSGVLNIPDTVTYGGNTYRVTALLDSAFYNCSGLTQVTLPTTLTSIGFFVFKGVAPSDSMTLVCQSEVPPTMNENTLYTYYGFSGTSGQTDLNHWRNNVRLQVPCPGFPSYQQSNGWREVVNILGVNTNPHYYDTICAGDGYHLHNYNFDAPTQGVYLSTNPINWGCVYNATLHLVVNPVYRENYYYYYCDGLYNYHSFNNFGFNVGAYGPHVWVDTSISSNGCDSITTLTFNKLEASTSFNDHVCERMEYSFFYNSNLGFHLYDWETHPGDTTIDIQKIFIPVSDGYTVYQGGCSQRVTAHVYINPILRDTTVATVCQGSTYTWNVNGYNQVGGYVSINHLIDSTTFLSDSLYTYNGCYNYQSLDLSVLPLNDTTIYDTICGNDHVVFNGQEYSTPGVYHAVLNNRFGCDSTVTLHLTVLDAYASSSTFNGRVIFQSDFSNSADLNDWSINNGINGWRVRDGALRISQSNSTNSYNLYAFSNSYATYSFNSGVYDSIEISFPYNVNGETGYDYLTIFLNGNSSGAISFTNGTYYTKYLNSNPNTTQTLTLYWHNDNNFGMSPAVAINEMSIRGITSQVYNHPVNSIESNICVGDTFHFGIHSYSQSGTFDDTLFTTNGCDSILRVNLHVHQLYNNTINTSFCMGDSILFGNQYYNTTTYATNSFQDHWGCDSVTNLNLTVWPAYDTTLYVTHIGDNPYIFHNHSITQSGTYTDTLPSQHGCDSVVVLILNIFPNAYTLFNDTICNGGTYTLHGFNVSTTGTYVQHLHTVAGSDSTVTLHLMVMPTYNQALYDTICNGETLTFGHHSLTAASSITDSLTTIHSCDSIVTMHLIVHPVFDTVVYDTVIGDSPYLFLGHTLTTSGIYTYTPHSQYGCDSVVHLHLQIYNTATTHIYDTICNTQTYNLHDFNETATGTYYRNLHTIVGNADSTSILHLWVNPIYNDTLEVAICDRTTYTSFGNHLLSTPGFTTDSLHTSRQCDSVMTLHLTVNPVNEITTYDTVRGDGGFVFYGNTYYETGLYTDTILNRWSCDSITHLHLKIYNTATTHIYDTICHTQTYNLHDFNETTTGTYYRNLHTTVGNADSTAILHLWVNPVYNDTLEVAICDRTTYTSFGNHILSTPGFTTDSLHTSRQCDSVITLHLTVNPVNEITTYDTVRGDEGFVFYGNTYYETGIYTDTIQNRWSCDSITHLHLKIYNTATTHIYDTICHTQTYNLHDFNETTTGTYYRNLHTIVGNADSTAILHLWVNPVYNDTLEVAICDRTSYTSFGNHILSTPGFTTDSLHTSRQCDSVITLHLTVNPVYEVPVFDTLRNDDPYNFYGTNLYQTGLYCDTLPTIHGCDSIIHLALQIYNNAYTSLYDTLCDRDTYQNYGFTLTRAGTYIDSLHTSYGADSVVSMHLWVNPVYEVDVFDTICSNRFLIHHGDTLYTTGSYTDTLSSIHGCDSIITLHLWTLPSYHDTSRVEICDNENYQFHFHEPLTEPGIYHYFMNAHNGCDSIETLFLTVHPIYNDTLYDSILTTENYTFGTHTLYDPGFYTDSLSSQFGCDSVVHLQLSHFYLHTLRLHDTICNGDSLIFNNFVCTRDSIYTDTLTANDNMDSLIVLFLHVNPVYNDTLYDSIFCTQYLIFGNDTISNAGLYTHYLQSIHGCDSVVTLALYQHTTRDFDSTVCMDRMPLIWNGITFPDTLVFEPTLLNDTAIVWNDTAQRNILLAMHVTVTPNPIQTIMDTIVENQLPFNFRGHIYNGNVTADTLLLPAAIGCDTTTYYSLFYHPNVHATADTTICFRQIPFLWNGATFSTHDGVTILTDTTTLVSHTGSDSLLTMNVHILQNSYAVRHDTIMENQLPYSVHGHIYFGPCNLDTITLTNAVGCDSIIYFRLIVMGNTVTQIDSTLCDYLLPLNWNGVNFDDDGTTDLLTDTNILHNIYGADSMIIMRVHILRCTSHVYDSTVCSAMLPLRWNGITFNTPNNMPSILIDSLLYHTSTGADSLIILRLHVNETFNQIFFDTICNNHPYTFLNEEYNASTTLNASLHTIAGCDSNVTVHLTAYPVETSMFEDVICEGIPYYWIDGHTYNEPSLGNMTTLHTMHGCDSIVYLNLLAGEEPNAIISAGATWIPVDNNKVRLEDGTLHGEYRQWVFPDSISTDKVVTYTYPIDYDSVRIWLMATNHDGCSDTTSILLRLDRDFSWAPNAFTPTSENNNRFFIAIDGIATIKVAIYNRSGMLMYQYEGLDGFWDGRYHGEVCPQAAYTYIVQYTTIHQPKQILKKVGTVLLLR